MSRGGLARRCMFLVLLMSIAGNVAAHGLSLEARRDADAIIGTAAYSSGEPASELLVELFATTRSQASAAPVASAQTDGFGRFRFASVPAGDYRLVAYGEEDHHASHEISATRRGPVAAESQAPHSPVLGYWIVGAIIILTLCMVSVRRRRG